MRGTRGVVLYRAALTTEAKALYTVRSVADSGTVLKEIYRGLNDYQYYLGGFLLIIIV